MQYISDTWISSTVFPPKDWSVYGQAIRTNNDIERWHNGLNRHELGTNNLSFYLLIQLLKREAGLCAMQARLVSKRKLQYIQGRNTGNSRPKSSSCGNNMQTVRRLLPSSLKLAPTSKDPCELTILSKLFFQQFYMVLGRMPVKLSRCKGSDHFRTTKTG